MAQKPNTILIVEDRADWQDILCSTLAQQSSRGDQYHASSLDCDL